MFDLVLNIVFWRVRLLSQHMVPFFISHNSEAEAIDLLMEVRQHVAACARRIIRTANASTGAPQAPQVLTLPPTPPLPQRPPSPPSPPPPSPPPATAAATTATATVANAIAATARTYTPLRPDTRTHAR
eukprot:2924708-Pleurochrysis_carterae.AAC.1